MKKNYRVPQQMIISLTSKQGLLYGSGFGSRETNMMDEDNNN